MRNPFLKNGIDTIGQSLLTKQNCTNNCVQEVSNCQNRVDEPHNSCLMNCQINTSEGNGYLKSNLVAENIKNGKVDEVSHKKDLVNGVK
jgi:hypothetical protein